MCADDLADNVLDPEITIANRVTGTYRLWIAALTPKKVIPGLLVITARPDFGLAEFDPASS